MVKELAAELPKLTDVFEAVLVEDCGGDGSWDVIQRLAAEYEWVRGFKLMRNYGQHSALLCGIRAASFEIVVTMGRRYAASDSKNQRPARQTG